MDEVTTVAIKDLYSGPVKVMLTARSSRALSKKSNEWLNFAYTVINHVENYSVPQYGPDITLNSDVENPKDCMKYISKYIQRYGSERRGRIEELRDLLKIAHFAQIAFHMMQVTEEEYNALENGRR